MIAPTTQMQTSAAADARPTLAGLAIAPPRTAANLRLVQSIPSSQSGTPADAHSVSRNRSTPTDEYQWEYASLAMAVALETCESAVGVTLDCAAA
jgi:hypothetical protein